MGDYQPARMGAGKWGETLDRNLFTTNHHDRERFSAHGADVNSVVGDPQFADPLSGDFTVRNMELAKAIGFKNFPMGRFGVQKPSLKAIAQEPEMPEGRFRPDAGIAKGIRTAVPFNWMGVEIQLPRAEEMSAYGVSFDTKALAVATVDRTSPLGGEQGLQAGDLILELNDHRLAGIEDLRLAFERAKDGGLRFRIIRDQESISVTVRVHSTSKP
jgi:hypothetical protein